MLYSLYCFYKWCSDGIGWGLIYVRVWVGDRRWILSDSFFSCAFVICSRMSSVLSFRWLEHGSCCACFFVFFVSCPFNEGLLMHRNCVSGVKLCVKSFEDAISGIQLYNNKRITKSLNIFKKLRKMTNDFFNNYILSAHSNGHL